MNYSSQIKGFYNFVMFNSLSTGEIALYNALMIVNEKCNFKESFTCSNIVLQNMTGLSRQGLDRARKALVNMKLIEYIKGFVNRAGEYKVIPLAVDNLSSLEEDVDVSVNNIQYNNTCEDNNVQNSSTLDSVVCNSNSINTTTITNNNSIMGNFYTLENEPEDIKEVAENFSSWGFKDMCKLHIEKIKELIQFYGREWVEKAGKIAALACNARIPYVEGILRNWKRDGKKDRKGEATYGGYSISELEKLLVFGNGY